MPVADVDRALDDLLDLPGMHGFVGDDSLADHRHGQVVTQGNRWDLLVFGLLSFATTH